MPKHSFSLTALGTFKNCPRCFWLEKVQSINRLRGERQFVFLDHSPLIV